jgi:3-hydroxybutyryl-CoA dehydrogenase
MGENRMKEGIKKIAIIGAGTMGHGIAQSFAQAGYQVSMMSRTQKTLSRALSLIESSLSAMVEEDMIDPKSIPATMSRIHSTTSIEEAAYEAEVAFETMAEDKDAKKEVFAQLDKYCPSRTLLASNTTYLNIFDFVETSRPEKVLIAHWYAPPQIIPLVDVVKGPKTDMANVELMADLLRDIDKKPAVFKKYVPGYVVTRLQIAFQREVHYLLDHDYLAPGELDEAAKWGLALRMMVIGVVQRIDFGGLDLTARNLEKSLFPPTPLEYKPKKIFELVKQGHFGVKTGKGFYDYQGRTEAEVCRERDIKLIKMLKALKTI